MLPYEHHYDSCDLLTVGLWEAEGVGLGSENLSSPLLLSKLPSLKASLFLTSERRKAKTGILLCDDNKAKSVIVFAY